MRAARILILLSSLAAASALSGCTGLRVVSDSNPDVSTSVCASFAWAGEFRSSGGQTPIIPNPLIESRLRTAIAANLQAKGVSLAAPGSAATCIVGYGIGRRTTVQGGYPYGWGWGWGWPGPYGWGWDGPYVYERGLIAINLYQARDRQPIWHAVVEQDLSGLTGHDAEVKINEAVAALFAQYPH